MLQNGSEGDVRGQHNEGNPHDEGDMALKHPGLLASGDLQEQTEAFDQEAECHQ